MTDAVKEPVPDAEVKQTKTSAFNKPAPNPSTIEKVVKETPKDSFTTFIDKAKINGTLDEKALIASMEDYIAKMAPGNALEASAGAFNQYSLWKTLQTVIESSPATEFKSLWNIVLSYFNEHQAGVFNDRYVFRFASHWTYGEEQLTAFQRLLNLINLTCNVQNRNTGLRQVNIQATLEKGYTEEGKNRLVSFYNM